ncbi:MAG: hypothetical protein LUE24_10480, partial [Lachnospiraceae bacterium]|nr:hypothetical protein [Lachnospiraceae bacterium]
LLKLFADVFNLHLQFSDKYFILSPLSFEIKLHSKVTFLPVCPKVLHFQVRAKILTKRRQMTSEDRNFSYYNDETT